MATPTLELKTGRSLYLQSLDQSLVYEGLLAGPLTAELNRRCIDRLIEKARTHLGGAAPYLVPPFERPIEDPRPAFARRDPAVALPSVACIARFHSGTRASDPTKDYSELVVRWFQDEFALPIAPSVREHLRELDWDRYAFDYDY